LDDLLCGKETEHNIFVLGLAGDFCVRDTAINLAIASMQAHPNVRFNVYVIQYFTRYAQAPLIVGPPLSERGDNLQFVDFDPTLGNITVHAHPDAKFDVSRVVLNPIPKTQIDKYEAELHKGKRATNIAKHDKILVKQMTATSIRNPLKDSLDEYARTNWHFLTDPRDILADYKAHGVTLLMLPPDLRPRA